MNEYEKEAVGQYELYRYGLKNRSQKVDESAQLNLNGDKTFEFRHHGKTITGNWNADDNGDWTLIDLMYGNDKDQGRIGRDQLTFYSVNFIGLENFEDLQFVKQ
jgi:hypothetical protein